MIDRKSVARLLVLTLGLLALAVAPAPRAHAEGGAVKKEIDFAKGLGRRGYSDWAEEVCVQIEKTASGADKAAVQLVRAEIMKSTANTETDLAKKMELINKAIKSLEQFLNDNSGHELAEEARFEIGELYLQKGLFINDELKNPEKAGQAAELRKEGQDAFKQAQQYIEKMISAISKRMDSPKDAAQTEKDATALMTARYNMLRACYYFGMMFEEGDSGRKGQFEKAKQIYMEFALDYQDRYLYYDACVVAGNVYKALASAKDSLACFDAAVSLRDLYWNDAKKCYELDDTATQVLTNAFYQKVQAANELKDGKSAVKTVDDFFETFGAAWKNKPLGWVMMLEKAKGFMLVPDNKAAMDLIAEVLDKTKDGPEAIRSMASALISKLGGTVEVSADRVLQGADALLSREKFDQAIDEFRKAITALKSKTDAESVKLLAKAWYRMAAAFDRQDRTYEAAALYQKVYTAWPTGDYASKACLGCARAFSKMVATGDNPFDQDSYRKALNDLSQKYVATEEGKMAPVLLGEKLAQEGKFTDAAAQFANVPSTVGAYYVQCLFQVGYCWYQEGKRVFGEKKPDDAKKAFDKAQDGFKKCLAEVEKATKNAPDESVKEQLGEIAFNCQFMPATILMHEANKKYAEALTLLDTLDKQYGTTPERAGRISLLKITCHLETKKPDEARKLLDVLLEKDLGGKRLPETCRSVAVAYHTIGEEKRKDKKPEDPAGLDELKLAARYYSVWLQRSSEGAKGLKPQEVLSVADLLYRVANVANGFPEITSSFQEVDVTKVSDPALYDAAARAYDLMVNGKFAAAAGADQWKVCVKMVNCYGFMKKWSEGAEVYEKLLADGKFEKEITDAKQKLKALRIDDKSLRAAPHLLGVYLDLGQIHLELAPTRKESWARAQNIFGNIGDPSISDKEQRQWWLAKLGILQALYGGGDYQTAHLVVKDLLLANPKWENDKFGLAAKFDAIKELIVKKVPQGGK